MTSELILILATEVDEVFLDPRIQLVLAILSPTLLLFIGCPLVFLLCRYRHRRRMDALSSRERILGAYNVNGDLRAEQAGDSTLQVAKLCGIKEKAPFNHM